MWPGHPPRQPSLPPFSIVFVLEALAGHMSPDPGGLVL
jgi:hypothetical protein